ncbi:MAG: alpha/beta fold hydrolase [Pseudomonadota bacterium]
MSSMPLTAAPAGPNLIYSLFELPRVVHEMSLLLPANRFLKRLGGGQGEPVMVLPGFAADDRSTVILRNYLNAWGYDARPWGVGQNLNPREMVDTRSTIIQIEDNLEVLRDLLERLKTETGEKVSLIGWSLGGIVSRQLASRHPELVSKVITMGTPFGDFRSTAVYPLLQRWLKSDVSIEDIETWNALTSAPLGDVPMTVIYSNSDGFVPPDNARDAQANVIEFIEVVCSHVGFGVHPVVFKLLSERLQQKAENWQAFSPTALERLLYRTS